MGDCIIIGGINQKDASVTFDKTEIPVDGIVFSDYQMEYGGYGQQRSAITVVISENKLEQLDFIKGFKEIRIFDNNIEDPDRMEVNNLVNKIMNGIEGGSLYVKSVIQEAERQYVQYIHLSGIFTVSILILFLVYLL